MITPSELLKSIIENVIVKKQSKKVDMLQNLGISTEEIDGYLSSSSSDSV